MMIIKVINDSGIADELTDQIDRVDIAATGRGASGCPGSMGRDRGFIHKQSFSLQNMMQIKA